MSTCSKCLGRMQPSDYDFAKRAAERLGKPYKSPKVCFECVMSTILSWPDDPSELADDEPSGGPA